MTKKKKANGAPKQPTETMAPAQIRDRVVDFVRARAGDLLKNKKNWRTHGDEQRAVLDSILTEVGFAGAVLARRTPKGLELIDGHLRTDRDPEAIVPVLVTDLTEEEADKLLATYDPLAAMAGTDWDALQRLVKNVKIDSEPIANLLAEMMGAAPAPKTVAEPADATELLAIAKKLQRKWKTAKGQLWHLGDHRVLCGDCARKEDVALVMDGQVDLVVTDPPYAVNYAAKNRALQTIGHGGRCTTDIEGDTDDVTATADNLWAPAFEHAYVHAKNGAPIYCFAPQGGDQMMMMMAMVRSHWNKRLHQLIWRKNAPTFSMGRLDYQYQHEPIFYTWKGTGHSFYAEVQSSVIDHDRPRESKEHPTMKPVGLIALLVNNSSRPKDKVYDPFLGSGTTLIACEQSGRCCIGLEVSPAYVAVGLERWSKLTGKKPTLRK